MRGYAEVSTDSVRENLRSALMPNCLPKITRNDRRAFRRRSDDLSVKNKFKILILPSMRSIRKGVPKHLRADNEFASGLSAKISDSSNHYDLLTGFCTKKARDNCVILSGF